MHMSRDDLLIILGMLQRYVDAEILPLGREEGGVAIKRPPFSINKKHYYTHLRESMSHDATEVCGVLMWMNNTSFRRLTCRNRMSDSERTRISMCKSARHCWCPGSIRDTFYAYYAPLEEQVRSMLLLFPRCQPFADDPDAWLRHRIVVCLHSGDCYAWDQDTWDEFLRLVLQRRGVHWANSCLWPRVLLFASLLRRLGLCTDASTLCSVTLVAKPLVDERRRELARKERARKRRRSDERVIRL